MSVEPGALIGRYEIQRKLGRGGMGSVYVAHDPVLGRMVAIKMFSADVEVPDASDRFWREARSAALLSHPNIVTIYDFGEVDGQPYIVMEYVPGEPLMQIIRRKAAVSLTDKLRWMTELCAGAGYAHRMSIVHRDIKPANLIIDKAGRLKILDFGIARMLGTASNTGTIGTPGYMAPEQIRGETVDHRADLFSIGVVFYELMAFTEAFRGESPATVMHRVLFDTPVPLRQLVVDCHPDIAAICERALQKNRDDRFPDAASMNAAIDRLRHQLEADASLTLLPGAQTLAAAQAATAMPAAPEVTDSARGTGAAARESNTPAPARRTDREAVARRRAELIEAALQEGRQSLEFGNFGAALIACERALAIDESNAEALALEAAVHERLARVAASTAAEAETHHMPPPRRDDAGAGTGVTGADAAAAETMFAAPPSDTQLKADDNQTVFRDASATVLADTAPPVMLTPAAATPAAATPAAARPSRSTPPTVTKKSRSRAIIALGAAALVLVAVATAAFLMRGPVPTGVLVIDTAPWAYVTRIQAEDGTAVPLPASAATPLSLTLAAGKYQVTLKGPAPASVTRQVQVEVKADGVQLAPPVQFEAVISVDDYFAPYLDVVAPEPEAETAP